MLNGQVFKNQLFENQIFALFINSLYNGECGILRGYLNSMAISNTSSTITISSGACCIKGRFLEEDTETTIEVEPNTAFNILVIEIDLDKENTETEFTQAYYKIIQGAQEYPTLTQEHIENTNSGVYQFELARFKTDINGIYDIEIADSGLDYNSIYQMIEDKIDTIIDGSAFTTKAEFNDFKDDVDDFMDDVDEKIGKLHPVGCIYLSMNSTNPSTYFGGTWTRIAKGRVLVGVDENDTDFNASNKTGGAKTVTLTTNQIPSHTHSYTGYTTNSSYGLKADGDACFKGSVKLTSSSNRTSGGAGSGQAHTNMQPFLTCYIFQRTA